MIDGKKNIEAWFEQSAMPYWVIYHRGKTDSGNPSFKSDDREGVTHNDAFSQLKKVLGLIGRGQYTIIASPASKVPPKGTYREDFEISINESQGPQASSQVTAIAGPTLSADDIKAQIKAGIDQYKREVEMESLKKEVEELKKQNKELEKSTSDPMNKFIGAIAPYSEHIVRSIFPVAQVAGMPQADSTVEENATGEVTELTPEQNERLSNALSVFAQHDPEWLQTLEKMATKLQSNPNLLTMIKSFI